MKKKKTRQLRFTISFILGGWFINFLVTMILEQVAFTRGTTGIAPDLSGAVEGALMLIVGGILAVIFGFLYKAGKGKPTQYYLILVLFDLVFFFTMMLLFWGSLTH